MPSATRLLTMSALTIRTTLDSSGKPKRLRSGAPGPKRAKSMPFGISAEFHLCWLRSK